MRFARRRSRRAIAGIFATVIMFAILFTVGTSYFLFVQAQNASYAASLVAATNKEQASLQESLTVNTLIVSNGDVGFTVTNPSTLTANVTAALVISSTNSLLRCDGIGFPAGAGCAQSTPALWMAVPGGTTSSSVDTGYLYTQGTTVTVKLLSARGNTYSAQYPAATQQSTSSQSVTVNLDNLRWVQLIPQSSSLVQKKYASNCNAAACAVSYSSSVTAGNILVAGVGWANSAPPASVPSDTLHDSFTLGSSSSLTTYTTPAAVQDGYTANCNAASCGLAFGSNVASGDTLVYAVGWTNHAAPSTPTDTRGDAFTLGESNSVSVTPPTPALIQDRYNSNCNNATCGLAYSSPVTAGNQLVFGLGWYGTFPYVPITVTNCQSPYTLGIDGDNSNSGTSHTLSAALTTQLSNDVVIAIVYGQNTQTGQYRTPTMSDTAGLTWNARSSLQEESNAGGNSMYTQIFYAIAASPLTSDNISVTWSSSPTLYGWIQVFGVSGANTSSPFDSNSALPAFATAGNYATVSTSNANDFVYGLENTAGTSAPTVGTGFAPLVSGQAASYTAGDYAITSVAQGALTMTYSNAASDSDMAWGDAIQGNTGCSSTPLMNLDGSVGSETETTSTSGSLTTATPNDVIIVEAGTSLTTTTVSSVHDAQNHTWTHRGTETGSGNTEEEEWYTIAATPLTSDSITVTWSAAGDNTMSAFGISGANLAAPFDTHAGLPAVAAGTNTTPTVSVSTSNANDFIFGMVANEHTSTNACHTETDETGYADTNAQVCALGSSTTQNNDQEYDIVSSAQTGISVQFSTSTGGSNVWTMIGDAVQAAPSSATASTFQEMVNWNPSLYSSYESSTLGNVRFCTSSLCSTLLYSWLESCSPTCTNSATSATAWVKLTSAINSGSTTTVYMVFESPNATFDGNYWGEAPTLSGTYGQYDNGANVFTFYDNFSGSTLDSNWQSIIYGGGTVTVNNGVTLSDTSTSNNPMLVSKSTYTPAVEDASMALTSKQTAFSTPSLFYATVIPATSGGDFGFKTDYRFDWYQPSTYFRILQDSGGSNTGSNTVLYSSLPTSYNVWSATWSGTGSESFSFNYVTQNIGTLSGVTFGSSYIGASATQGGSLSVQWLRLRATPPNGIMPTTSFGSLTSGNGTPSNPSDTFGDTFTLGTSNFITVSNQNYYSYIWYGTAATSGSDTISVTFSSAVTGSVSIYELTGYNTASPGSSTGYSNAGSTAPAVTSFTPSSNSFVIGNVESGSSTSTYTAGSGFTIIAACSSVYGCNEYKSGVGSATTVPFTLSVSAPWVESAISFAPQIATTYYSYIWYATAGSSGADTISANFGTSVTGSVSIYEVSGVTTAGAEVGVGSSSTPQSAGSVAPITPSAGGSFVIGNAEAGSNTFTAGSGFTLAGSCTTAYGCSEYQAGVASATTAPITFSTAVSWAESAVALNPVATNYYSYIWYATATTSGANTVTTTFSQTTQASVSIYEITGYTLSGALSSTGSLQAGSTTAGVSSFTPATDSFTVGQVEDALTTNTFTATSGFTLSGTASSVEGAGEYNAGGGGSASTVPFTLGTSSPWVEAAMSFSTPFNPQSGIQVGGYPTMGVPSGASIVWEVTFTNVDPNQRTITIWPQTELAIGSAEYDGFDTDYTQAHYYIISSLNAGSTTVNAYTTTGLITLQYDVPTTLYFAATQALGSTTQAFGTNVLTPFEAYFALTGIFGDGTLFGETIPYPYGIITQSNAYTTPTVGATGATVTVSCTSPCYFNHSSPAVVGWINAAGQFTQVASFTTTSSGAIPAGVTFQVPSSTAGYYTLEVTDYINSVFMTFQHT